MSEQLFRLPSGGRIDRSKCLTFYFNGKSYTGYEGDTLASALIANGVKLVGRSFKYHRPRGILSAGTEECNALVQLESGAFDEPNVRATLAPLYDGLRAKSQNCWPSVDFDIYSILSYASSLLPVAFYYKTFMWPNWHWYEGFIRKSAGMGTVPREKDAQYYVKRNAHTDVLVVGAGPAGLAAAQAAADTGARVFLIDEQEEMGGSLLWEDETIDSLPGDVWVRGQLDKLENRDNVTLLNQTTVTGYYDHNVLVCVERLTDHQGPAADSKKPRQRLWKIRAKQVILATGAHERPLVFPNNDRPGIMLASAVRHYIWRYGVLPGRSAVIATNNDDAYRTVLSLLQAGAVVEAVVDVREHVTGPLVEAVRKAGVRIYNGHVIKDVEGSKSVKSVTICALSMQGKLSGENKNIPCDLIAISGGWNPMVHLYSQAMGKLRFDDDKACFIPTDNNSTIQTVGALNGNFSLSDCLKKGQESGVKAATELGFSLKIASSDFQAEEQEYYNVQAYWKTPAYKLRKQWVDFQHDVTVDDVEIAARENFISVEHLKRYTTAGMSVDQGKTSNVNGLAILAEATNRKIPQVGTTKFRPPFLPVTLGTLKGEEKGELYRPRLEMPVHEWHRAHRGSFIDAGGWQRPEYYLNKGENAHQATVREVKAIRNNVGLFEGSPLGKIEVRGRDAADFINRFYINNVLSLKQGKVRYGLMLTEAGIVMDDGVFAKLADDHYLLSPTSAGAGRVLNWLEEWLNVEWPHYEVLITAVTTQWATCTISGPNARKVLEKLEIDVDFSKESFPHMSIRSGQLGGVPIRIQRVSFTGELSYEVNVPASYGKAMWEMIMAAGQAFDIIPYGAEALLTLRLEKGYLHIGGDTDGTTVPDDLGWGRVASNKKVDFLGRRSLTLPESVKSGRKQLVGYAMKIANGAEFLPVGSHVIIKDNTVSGMRSIGYVTSSCFSPTLNKPIAMGIINDGNQKIGEKVTIFSDGQTYQAEVVEPVFYDKQGERLNG